MSWRPTKKWYALVAVERGMTGTLVVAAVGAYFKSNDQTATKDGVPS
jgi:hypothetical protein